MKKVTNDHRSRVTKMLIRKAFMELLRQKPLASISVKELCELAGINRGTFYSHYQDVYDLLDQLEQEMMNDFQKALEPLLEAKPFHPVEISTGIFRCLQDNSDLCTVTLGTTVTSGLPAVCSISDGKNVWKPIYGILRRRHPVRWSIITPLSARAALACCGNGWRTV